MDKKLIISISVIIIIAFISILLLVINNTNKNQVKSFLVSNKLISTSNTVAANTPDGYIFLENGKIAYYNYSFNIGKTNNNGEIEFNRIISNIGTWSINNDKLILKVEKEEYAIDGEEIDEQPYPYLTNYKREVKDVNKTTEYTINNNNDSSYLSLSTNNTEIKWYQLSIGEDLNIPKALAENGYNETYDQLTK